MRIVRLTRPSVIATWLPDWVAGENHGDHQAAGVLATEAFDMAGDPTAFPEQVATPRNREDYANLTEGLRPWQPEKLYCVSDTVHADFLQRKGPVYSATDISPSQRVAYAKLAAEECAYHLTQDDTGQIARTALAHNDFRVFNEPVFFILGKSYVKSSITGDLFEGVVPVGIAYHRAPGFSALQSSEPSVELGGPWHFYKQFWQARGIEHLSTLVPPEILAKPSSTLLVPVSVDNPTDSALDIHLAVTLPEGWTVTRSLPSKVTADAHERFSLQSEVKLGTEKYPGWKTIAIDANANGKDLGHIRIRVQRD